MVNDSVRPRGQTVLGKAGDKADPIPALNKSAYITFVSDKYCKT